MKKCAKSVLPFTIGFRQMHQHADASNALALLRASGERLQQCIHRGRTAE